MIEFVCGEDGCKKEYHHKCIECNLNICHDHADDHEVQGHEVESYS